MCEHCNHERELKVGDRVKVDWQKALESNFGDACWITENVNRKAMEQGIITAIDPCGERLRCRVNFYAAPRTGEYKLWLNKDWLSLVEESEKENDETMSVNEEKVITCEHCGCVIPEGEERKTWNGNYICEDCTDEYYICDDCGDYMSPDDEISVYDGNRNLAKHVCPYCADEYPVCVECGERVLSECLVDTGWGGADLCEYCAENSDNWDFCANCGEWHEGCEYIDGDYYCESCAEEIRSHDCHNSENSGYVNSYGYKPRPRFHSVLEESDGNSPLYMGVELEIDSDDEDTNAVECADELHDMDYNADFFYLKHDGSLNEPGIEIVTHPCTLAYHMQRFPWKEIVDTARSNGYSSHDIGTCGLHVHVSRDALGGDTDAQDLTIAKIVIMMDKLWDYLVKFSRRDYSQLQQWAKKMDARVDETDSDENAIEKTNAAAGYERYHALNLQNRNTIEFRLFRGTLKLNTIMATLQFVDGLCRYAMAHSVKECLATDWMDLASSIDYPEFRQYLRERGLVSAAQPEQDDGNDADED